MEVAFDEELVWMNAIGEAPGRVAVAYEVVTSTVSPLAFVGADVGDASVAEEVPPVHV